MTSSSSSSSSSSYPPSVDPSRYFLDAAETIVEQFATTQRKQMDVDKHKIELQHKEHMAKIESEIQKTLTPEQKERQETEKFYSGLTTSLQEWKDIRCSWFAPKNWRELIETKVLVDVQRRGNDDIRRRLQDRLRNFNCSDVDPMSALRESLGELIQFEQQKKEKPKDASS